MKIYKYNILKTPDAVKFARGFLQVGDYAIGFGNDNTTPDKDKECEELTFAQYIAYAQSINVDTQLATDIYNKYAGIDVAPIMGEKAIDKKQVSELLRKNIQALFVDPNGLLNPIEYQVLILSQVLVISLANAGTIKYEEIGIPAITDKTSADAYIQALLPIWSQVNILNQEAVQFAKEKL